MGKTVFVVLLLVALSGCGGGSTSATASNSKNDATQCIKVKNSGFRSFVYENDCNYTVNLAIYRSSKILETERMDEDELFFHGEDKGVSFFACRAPSEPSISRNEGSSIFQTVCS